jgi:Beta protein
MTFDANHYVPVLKVKRGEKKALTLLSRTVRTRITPFLEIVERSSDKPLEQHLQTSFKDFFEAVSGFHRCFIDTREIAPDGPDGAKAVFQWAADAGISFTPVTGISRSVDLEAALAFRDNGLALRIERGELEAGGLAGSINAFLSQHSVVPEDIDLFVDLGAVDTMVLTGVRKFARAFLEEVPYHERWRTFTLSACAFPQSMGVIKSHSDDTIDRVDWMAWRDGLHAHQTRIARLPTYSDCGIQHPKGVEGFDPRKMQVSASIRYAIKDCWLIIKGESTRITPPSQQFPSLARALVNERVGAYYYGADHCSGCSAMMACANGGSGYGSAEAWRRLGTVHHITKVVEDLDALS